MAGWLGSDAEAMRRHRSRALAANLALLSIIKIVCVSSDDDNPFRDARPVPEVDIDVGLIKCANHQHYRLMLLRPLLLLPTPSHPRSPWSLPPPPQPPHPPSSPPATATTRRTATTPPASAHRQRMQNFDFEAPLAHLMSEGQPGVVRGLGSALEWAALEDEAWSKAFFKREMPELKVHVSRAPTSRLYSAAHPLFASFNDDDIVWRRPYAEANVSATAFLAGSTKVKVKVPSHRRREPNGQGESAIDGSMGQVLAGHSETLRNAYRDAIAHVSYLL